MVPADRDKVLIVKGAEIVIEKVFVLVEFFASNTLTVKLEVPAVVGIPKMVPVEFSSDNPTGRLPAIMDQE